jgi:hypothetical protein
LSLIDSASNSRGPSDCRKSATTMKDASAQNGRQFA